jgi:hypothetical protein
VVNGSTEGANLRWRLAFPAGVVLATVILSACGGTVESNNPSPSPSVPPLQSVVASAASGNCAPCVVKGPNRRLTVGILDASGTPVGGGVSVQVQVYVLPPGGQPTAIGPAMEAPYEGAALLQNKGVYVVHQTFGRAGFYNVVVRATKGSISTTTTAAFQVIDSDPGIAVGSPAPRTQNPTASQVSGIREIDTNVPPDDMHYTSIAAAIAARHPVVAYFGSPGFCRSKNCGPETDVVKSLEPAYRPKGVDFVHIETYKGGTPDNTDLAKATVSPFFEEWKLNSDPWVIVVDKNGVVAAKFDGPTGADEIDAVLRGLT